MVTPFNVVPETTGAGTGQIRIAAATKTTGTGQLAMIAEAAGGADPAGLPAIYGFSGTGWDSSWSAGDKIAINTTALHSPDEWTASWSADVLTLPGASTVKYLLRATMSFDDECHIDFYDGTSYYEMGAADGATDHTDNTEHPENAWCIASGGDTVSLRHVVAYPGGKGFWQEDGRLSVQRIGTMSNYYARRLDSTDTTVTLASAGDAYVWDSLIEDADGWTAPTMNVGKDEFTLAGGSRYEVTIKLESRSTNGSGVWQLYETSGTPAYYGTEWQPLFYSSDLGQHVFYSAVDTTINSDADRSFEFRAKTSPQLTEEYSTELLIRKLD